MKGIVRRGCPRYGGLILKALSWIGMRRKRGGFTVKKTFECNFLYDRRQKYFEERKKTGKVQDSVV